MLSFLWKAWCIWCCIRVWLLHKNCILYRDVSLYFSVRVTREVKQPGTIWKILSVKGLLTVFWGSTHTLQDLFVHWKAISQSQTNNTPARVQRDIVVKDHALLDHHSGPGKADGRWGARDRFMCSWLWCYLWKCDFPKSLARKADCTSQRGGPDKPVWTCYFSSFNGPCMTTLVLSRSSRDNATYFWDQLAGIGVKSVNHGKLCSSFWNKLGLLGIKPMTLGSLALYSNHAQNKYKFEVRRASNRT